jgi:hypothetical protein
MRIFRGSLTVLLIALTAVVLAGCGGSSNDDQTDAIARDASESIERLVVVVKDASAKDSESLVSMRAAASSTADSLSELIGKLDDEEGGSADGTAGLRKALVSQRALAYALAAKRLSAGEIQLAAEKAKFDLDGATGPQLPLIDTSGLVQSLKVKKKSSSSGAAPQTNSSAPSSSSGSGRVPASGTYTGTGVQRSASDNSKNKDYPVEMTFSSSGSTVSYPSLNCAGRLTPQGFNGGRRVYRESITSGHCDDGGIWEIEVVSDVKLRANWTHSGVSYSVSATLSR